MTYVPDRGSHHDRRSIHQSSFLEQPPFLKLVPVLVRKVCHPDDSRKDYGAEQIHRMWHRSALGHCRSIPHRLRVRACVSSRTVPIAFCALVPKLFDHGPKSSAGGGPVRPRSESENKASKVCLSARSYSIFRSKLQELAK